jgi:hypothetical protein
MKPFTIVPFKHGTAATLYSVHFHDMEADETTIFLNNSAIKHYTEDYQHLLVLLNAMTTQFGCREQFFRFESKASNAVCALYRERNRLVKIRLCCCRLGERITILGNGCVKKSQTSQEDPEYQGYINDMIRVDTLVTERIASKEIVITPRMELAGNLIFEHEE